MPYENFVFRLEAQGNGWTARVLNSPAGEGSGPFALEIDPKQCMRKWVSQAHAVRNGRQLLAHGRQPLPPDLRQVSEALFRALFPEEVRRLWERSLGLAAPGWLRIQLRMDLREPGVAPLLSLPWELIRDPETQGHWGLSRETPLARYVEMAEPRGSALPLPRPLRVLIVGSEPTDAPPLQIEREQRLIVEALAGQEEVEVVRLAEARLGALREAILDRGYHILHFMGHGDFKVNTGEGCLLFESSDKRSDRVSGAALATKLGGLKTLRLVVLNACHGGAMRGGDGRAPFSGVASALVRRGLPAVVAMQLPISDTAAIAFSRMFYRRLAAGDSIEVAVVEGRQAIHSEEHRSMEWAVPALFSRLSDGRLFDRPCEELPRAPLIRGEQESASRIATAEEIVDRTRRLLEAAGTSSLPDDVLTAAFKGLMSGDNESRVDRVLVEALYESSEPATVRAAARMVKLLARWTLGIAEALTVARHCDAAPWPVEVALRGVATHDPDLLPHSRSSLRRTLRRRHDLARRFLDSGAWRRLGLFVYGGLDDSGSFSIDHIHHESPELTREILGALEEDRPATSLVPALVRLSREAAKETRRDAALALAALGVPLDGDKSLSDELRSDLERLRSQLKAAQVTVCSFGGALSKNLRRLAAPRRDEVVRHILALVPERPSVPAALLKVARKLAPEHRVPWLAEVWRRLLTAPRPNSTFNLAVVLDTVGELLSDPPWLLAHSLALAVFGRVVDPTHTTRNELFVALDAVAALPSRFDFVRGWVLARLEKLLNSEGLAPEALILALGLSDRLSARRDTVRRLLPDDDSCEAWLRHRHPASVLVEMARSITDPLLRFRAYRRLGYGWTRTRDLLFLDRLGVDRILLAPASSSALEIEDPVCFAWAREELRQLISGRLVPSWRREISSPFTSGRLLLSARVDETIKPLSTLVALALVEDLMPASKADARPEPEGDSWSNSDSGKSVSQMGVKRLRELARDWLDRRDEAPSKAMVLRWSLESVEHDDALALARWADVLRQDERRAAAEAEAILSNIHAVRGHVWPTVLEVLETGCSSARRAILRSVCALLARRRLPDDVWQELVPALRLLGEDGVLEAEGFVLDGPGAVVSAGGAVRQVLANCTTRSDGAVEAAERAYERHRRPWSRTLLEPPAVLRATLESVGAERLVTVRSRAEVNAAADRLAGEPPVFEVLLEWASHHMRRDVQHAGRDDYLVSDLLCVLARVAEKLPDVYRRKVRSLVLWERQLCEAARFCDWYPARRAAIVLLGCGLETTARTVAALREALHDVQEVSEAAFLGLAHLRAIEPESVPKRHAESYYRWLYETTGLEAILSGEK